MKKLNKILSLTLSLALLISSIPTIGVFAATSFNDVTDATKYKDAIYELVDDGVINGYDNGNGTFSFKPEATITRAEFSKMLAVSLAGNADFSGYPVTFKDVQGHWAAPYIAYVSNLKIVNGYENGDFRPDNQVKYSEVVKMIVCALGYGPVIDTTLNPWYTGYVNMARQIGLTANGAEIMAENPASRGIVAQLLSNKKDCKYLVQSGVNADGTPKFEQSSNQTASNEDTDEDEGVLLGVYEYTLSGSDISLTRSEINIDGDTYKLSDDLKNKDFTSYVGKSVEYTYGKSGKNKNTIFDLSEAKGTEILEISAEQIETVSGDKIEYYETDESDDTDTIKLDSDLYIVYNGNGVSKALIDDDFIKEHLNVETGSILFYNNDGDSAMDVAFVESFVTYFTSSKPEQDDDKFTIYDKNGYAEKVTLIEDEVVVTKVTSKGGSESDSSLANIGAKNVVSVAKPLTSSESIKVIISSATASGEVTELGDNFDVLKIGGKDYEVSPYFEKLVKDYPDTYNFVRGSNVKVYLDHKGRIVSTEVNETDYPYGYLVKCKPISSGMDTDVKVQIFGENGSWVEALLKSRVKVDGKTYDAEEVPALLTEIAETIYENKNKNYVDEAAQLVKYKTSTVDGQEVVSELITIAGGIKLSSNSTCEDKDKLTYSSSGYSFGKFGMNTSTKVFVIPVDDRTEKKDYKVSKYNTTFTNGSSYCVDAYDVPSDGTKAAAVVYYWSKKSAGSINAVKVNTNGSFIVGRIVEGDNVTYTMLPLGKSVSETTPINAEKTSEAANFAIGDIVKYTTTGSEIDDIKGVYVGAELVGATDNYIQQKYNSDEDYYQAMIGIVYSNDLDGTTGVGTLGIAKDLEDAGKDEPVFKEFNVNSSTKFYDGEGSGKDLKLKDASHSSIRAYLGNANKASASNVLVIAYGGTARAIYYLD